jgi:hypothetical protein
VKLAWPTGDLVADDVTEDVSTVPGVPLPLDDGALGAWAGSVDPDLLAAAASSGVSLAAWLGWARSQGRLPYPDEARLLLARPDLYGFSAGDVAASVKEAAAWANARSGSPAIRSKLDLGGRTYAIEGRLARGDHADVLRARWESRLGELVVVKIAREASGGDPLRREFDALQRLARSEAQGAQVFSRLVPQPIALDQTDGRVATVYAWRAGFFVTAEQVAEQHRAGVDGRALVWLWKRTLELLGWAHRTGVVHGDVRGPHVLVHPRDHGATLVGWTEATPVGDALPDGTIATPNRDLIAAARLIRDLAASTPLAGPVQDLVADQLALDPLGSEGDAWEVRERLDAAGKAYGPPSYSPIAMPGWS